MAYYHVINMDNIAVNYGISEGQLLCLLCYLNMQCLLYSKLRSANT